MRLFAAVYPPETALADLERAVAPVRAAAPALQWTARARWHLTLAFYGEVPDGDVARLRRRIARAAKGAPPLELAFAGAGHFGGRVLWVGVAGMRDELRALARASATDGKPYRPHLTVARARRDGDVRGSVAALASYDGPRWRVGELLLVRSFLGPKPRHEPVARWPLAGG